MSAQDPMIGRIVLGRYRIVRPLAKGGMGIVYLARTEGASGFSKPFVVKRMATDILVDESMLKMFVREARLMSRLRHPGLVGVVDFGKEADNYLMVLEYIHGFHLGQWFRYLRSTQKAFPVDRILHLLIKVLDGLEYAHTLCDANGSPLGIVHRDVSPSNILIDVEGHVKLADFGVARSTEQTEHTEENTIKGKMPYLAPELFRLAKPTPGTDVYACAVVLHEVLVGKNEFRTGDMATTVSRVLEHLPTRVDQIRRDIPPPLANVLESALHKDPGVRFSSAGDLARALREIRQKPEQEADAALRTEAQRDFLNPMMAERLRVLSLTERDQAWRNPPPEIFKESPPRPSSSPPTVASTPSALDPLSPAEPTLVEQQQRRRTWIPIGVVTAVVIVASGIAVALYRTRPKDDDSNVFVVVQSNQSDAGSTDPAGSELIGAQPANPELIGAQPANPELIDSQPADPEPTGTETAVGQPSKTIQPQSPRSPPRQASTPQQLSRIFKRRQRAVMACFDSATTPRAELNVRFEVDRSGRVSSATITPATAGQTDAGRCVLRVARGIRFPPQPRSIAFSIPIAVHARPL